jgi:transmembrane sensor
MKRYRHKISSSVPEQAAEWLVELAEPTRTEARRREFMKWLKKSPQHIEEFLGIATLQLEVAEQSSVVQDIVTELNSRDDQCMVPLFREPVTPARLPLLQRHRRARYRAWASAAALAALVAIAIVLVQLPIFEPPPINHSTELGEQRSIVLDDGSIMILNTLSEATVQFSRATRQVTLVAGEAMFDVVSNPDRPFVVETGAMSLSVLGTKFSVYRKKNSTRLAVVEGAVSAVSRYAPGNNVVVRTGEGAVATLQGISLTDPRFDVEGAIAWTERRLIFDAAPLAEVVAEFNRYNRLPLVVEDSALANRAITTVFNAHDVSALVGFLQLEPDVEVRYGEDAIRIRVRR